ncbi:Sodium/myo-inositol cotransporter 2 [Portunus trituberculatus]|uniref:Sodium/myo-inositol cotransporter 2 n=1 Tax=Portunus trituberculatus TaxID=210409 RepID=A0A5B7FIN5_PORTR|nr:Sodium/myo-inositol cotransporter 2 [Portunus trituberculatus]
MVAVTYRLVFWCYLWCFCVLWDVFCLFVILWFLFFHFLLVFYVQSFLNQCFPFCTLPQADLYAGALFMQLALNKSSVEWLYLSILFLLVVAAAFTIAGGLAAVVWTDFVQTALMVVGAFILMGLGEFVALLKPINQGFGVFECGFTRANLRLKLQVARNID